MQAEITTQEAARLARSCAAVEQAASFSKWIGSSGPRTVTPAGALRKQDLPAAAAVIGVKAPEKPRTAVAVPAIHMPWTLAVTADLLRIRSGKAVAGPALETWPPADEDLLDAWFAGLTAMGDPGEKLDKEASLLAVLSVLESGSALTHPAFAREVVKSASSLAHEYDVDPDLGWQGDRRLPEFIARLELFGAIDGPGITPLGVWATRRMILDVAGPADLTAAEVITDLAARTGDDDLDKRGWSWLDEQPDYLEAARELLRIGAPMEPRLRWEAAFIVELLEEEAVPVWREMLSDPGMGPHAAFALWELKAGPEPADTQWLWLAVESAARALAVEGPDAAVSVLWESVRAAQLPVDDLDHRLGIVRATDHPSSWALASAIADYVAMVGLESLSVNKVLELKVTLKHFRPPIWRTVLVPATTNLGELHRIIQALFGWDGDHLHVFQSGGAQYSDLSFDLEDTRDEHNTSVERALAAGKLSYEYDLGASWIHEITLQKTLPRSPDTAYPVCVRFGGDSPVEYGDDEPGPFELAAVNHRLADM